MKEQIEYNELIKKIEFAGKWLEDNKEHPEIDEARARYSGLCKEAGRQIDYLRIVLNREPTIDEILYGYMALLL